jgi:hypothetical protein
MPVFPVDADLTESDTELFRFKISDEGEAQVQFMAYGKNPKHSTTDIATLALCMVQEVQFRVDTPAEVWRWVESVRGKRYGFGFDDIRFSVDTVDMNAMYNALGMFRGVQYARDEYTSTFSMNHGLSKKEIRGRRKPFLKYLSALRVRSGTCDTVEGLDELIVLIETHNKKKIQAAYSTIINNGMYDFDCLAELYKPGSSVVAKNVFGSGVDSLCKVTWCHYEERLTLLGVTRVFKVSFEFLVAVGGHFTLCEFVNEIESFDQNKRASLSSLRYIPLTALEQEAQTQLLLKLRQRGEVYAKCAIGAHFLGYSQGSFYSKNGGKSQHAALRTTGRVMVDTKGSYDAGHSVSNGYDPMVVAIKYKHKEYMLQMRQQQEQQHEPEHLYKVDGSEIAQDSYMPEYYKYYVPRSRRQQLPPQQQYKNESSDIDIHNMILFDTVPNDYLSMTWPFVVGFSFTSKSWGDVLVDGLEEIKFKEATFDRLVLPPAKKRMIKALVRHSSDSFRDSVSGKGEGSVFFLYGPPGVGKTLTAEAIGEMLRRPLYSVSVGQLGTTPAELETNLGEILDLCAKWDALILLHEADIFLEKCASNGSLERNSMVSIMLRFIENFKGVMFLTANRVDSLDPAFKTHITLALRYKELDKLGRNQVWLNLLDASGQGEAVEKGFINTLTLAENELNGSEIKKAIYLAMTVAKEDDVPLTQDAIMETVDILLDFNKQ